MAHATIPRNSHNFCNDTTSHTKPAAFTIQDLMDLLKLMDKAGREGKPWISGLYEYRVTPQSGSIALPLQLITQHLRSPRNAPNPTGTHEEARKQAGRELH